MSDQNKVDPLKVNPDALDKLNGEKKQQDIPEIDFPTMCQMRAADLIEMYLNQLRVNNREAAMMALCNLTIVVCHSMVSNSDKLVVQRLLSDLKKTVADMPGNNQIITDPNASKH